MKNKNNDTNLFIVTAAITAGKTEEAAQARQTEIEDAGQSLRTIEVFMRTFGLTPAQVIGRKVPLTDKISLVLMEPSSHGLSEWFYSIRYCDGCTTGETDRHLARNMIELGTFLIAPHPAFCDGCLIKEDTPAQKVVRGIKEMIEHYSYEAD